jgi:hypothetical protein
MNHSKGKIFIKFISYVLDTHEDGSLGEQNYEVSSSLKLNLMKLKYYFMTFFNTENLFSVPFNSVEHTSC